MDPLPLTVVPREAAASGPRAGEPVTFGIPFPKGTLAEAEGLVLIDADGRPCATQTRATEQWPDGSIRWALIDSQVSWPGQAASFLLVDDAAQAAAARGAGPRVSASLVEGDVVVETGPTRFVCAKAGAFPFARVTAAGGADVVDTRRSGLRFRDAAGDTRALALDAVAVEASGPVRATVCWRGHVSRGPESRWLDIDIRAHFHAGLPTVRLHITIRNPTAAVHPGNYWELGDSGSVLLQEAALDVAVAGDAPAAVRCSVDERESLAPCGTPFVLYQESSGGDRWNSPAHVNREGRVPLELCGYRLTTGGTTAVGRRASPVVTLTTNQAVVALAVPYFWQNCPRSVTAQDATLQLGLWPGLFPDLHELQGGEQKTHEVVLACGQDPVSAIPLDWCRAPALVRADPSWYCSSRAIPHLLPEHDDPSVEHRALARAAIEGPDTFLHKRERIDEYGWRHFGDLYADHENPAGAAPDASPVVSHYNNQYDAIAGFAAQFFRTADPRWWTAMDELAAHVVDIDIYHTAGDRAAYSGGPFWHTAHYVDAGRSTHRSYPKAPGVPGGGPGGEHNYTAGLVLHHFLTGSAASREAVIALADWVRRIDDGSLSPFRWFDRGPTGLASATRDPWYHGPGRGAAHSIAALLDGYRLTGNRAYLESAEALIRRCIHPHDDIEARGLLDAESRWSYTVFLQVLGRYLVDCADRGHLGFMYAWARECLVRYARWMADRERPYLEAPARLEFPTETWAAQDLRKCDVLAMASLLTRDTAERHRFLARATQIFRASVRSLSDAPTRSRTRPVVIALTNGWRLAWCAIHPDARLPEPAGGPHDFGLPVRFVPQRARVVARGVRAAGAAAVLATAALAGWVLW